MGVSSCFHNQPQPSVFSSGEELQCSFLSPHPSLLCTHMGTLTEGPASPTKDLLTRRPYHELTPSGLAPRKTLWECRRCAWKTRRSKVCPAQYLIAPLANTVTTKTWPDILVQRVSSHLQNLANHDNEAPKFERYDKFYPLVSRGQDVPNLTLRATPTF